MSVSPLPALPLLCPPSPLRPCLYLVLSLASASFGTAPCPQGETRQTSLPAPRCQFQGGPVTYCRPSILAFSGLLPPTQPSLALTPCPGLCSSAPPSVCGCLLPGVPFPQPQPWLPFTLASLMTPQSRITLGGWLPARACLKIDPCLGCFQGSLGLRQGPPHRSLMVSLGDRVCRAPGASPPRCCSQKPGWRARGPGDTWEGLSGAGG